MVDHIDDQNNIGDDCHHSDDEVEIQLAEFRFLHDKRLNVLATPRASVVAATKSDTDAPADRRIVDRSLPYDVHGLNVSRNVDRTSDRGRCLRSSASSKEECSECDECWFH